MNMLGIRVKEPRIVSIGVGYKANSKPGLSIRVWSPPSPPSLLLFFSPLFFFFGSSFLSLFLFLLCDVLGCIVLPLGTYAMSYYSVGCRATIDQGPPRCHPSCHSARPEKDSVATLAAILHGRKNSTMCFFGPRLIAD